MKKLIILISMLLTVPAIAADAMPTDATVTEGAPVSGATDIKDAAGQVKEAISAAKSGNWWYFSSIVCLVVMFALKLTKVLSKIGRWKYVILPVLSLAAALLAAFQGGVSVDTAVGVFTTSWATGMLEELWNHGILGKAHS